jgi:uncharacterized protein (TIGR02594 family)
MSHPWLDAAEADLGLKETTGPKTNRRILAMLDQADGTEGDGKTLQGIKDDETPWCSTATCAWMESAGIKSPRSAMARSWSKWGKALDGPAVGAVVVFWRGSRTGSLGHVGFVAGRDKAGHLMVIGGNQSNGVSCVPFGRERVLTYRWPTDYNIPATGFSTLPVIKSDGRVSTNEA